MLSLMLRLAMLLYGSFLMLLMFCSVMGSLFLQWAYWLRSWVRYSPRSMAEWSVRMVLDLNRVSIILIIKMKKFIIATLLIVLVSAINKQISQAAYLDSHTLKMQKYLDDSQEFKFQDLLEPYESINITLRVDFLHVNSIIKPIVEMNEIYPK